MHQVVQKHQTYPLIHYVKNGKLLLSSINFMDSQESDNQLVNLTIPGNTATIT